MDEREENASERIRDNRCYEWYFLIHVTCKLKAEADMKRKYMNTDSAQWKEPEWTTLIREVGVGTNMQSKQARVLQYKV